MVNIGRSNSKTKSQIHLDWGYLKVTIIRESQPSKWSWNFGLESSKFGVIFHPLLAIHLKFDRCGG